MALTFVSLGPVHLQANKASQKVPVTLVDATDGVTAETGVVTPTIQASKNGAAYASLSDGTWAELGNGDYTILLNATDTNTLGWLLIRVIKSGVTAESKVLCKVSLDPAAEAAMSGRVLSTYRESMI